MKKIKTTAADDSALTNDEPEERDDTSMDSYDTDQDQPVAQVTGTHLNFDQAMETSPLQAATSNEPLPNDDVFERLD